MDWGSTNRSPRITQNISQTCSGLAQLSLRNRTSSEWLMPALSSHSLLASSSCPHLVGIGRHAEMLRKVTLWVKCLSSYKLELSLFCPHFLGPENSGLQNFFCENFAGTAPLSVVIPVWFSSHWSWVWRDYVVLHIFLSMALQWPSCCSWNDWTFIHLLASPPWNLLAQLCSWLFPTQLWPWMPALREAFPYQLSKLAYTRYAQKWLLTSFK